MGAHGGAPLLLSIRGPSNQPVGYIITFVARSLDFHPSPACTSRAGLEWDPASERFSEAKRCISTFRRCASNRRDARRWNGAANQDLIHKKDIEQAPQVVSTFECIQIVDLRVPAVVARGKQIAIWLNLEQARNPCSRHRELPRPCCIIEGNPKSRPSPNCDSTSTFSPCKPSNIRT